MSAPIPPPMRLEPAPALAHCTCMSGLTESQFKLMALHGALHVIEWLAVEAQHAHVGPPPLGNPEVHERLLKFQLELSRTQDFCLTPAFPTGAR